MIEDVDKERNKNEKKTTILKNNKNLISFVIQSRIEGKVNLYRFLVLKNEGY